LKQAELAKSISIGTTVLARYEQGKVLDLTPWVLQKIAKTLKIDPAELLPGPEQANNKDFLDYFCPTNTWSSRLKKLRLSRNLQQKDLARMLGIHKVSLCRYEKDLIKPNKIMKKRIEDMLEDNCFY
jgi:transcriptional regulator with XRE-family HTH domain